MKAAVVLLIALLAAPVASGCVICVTKPLKFAFQDAELFFVGTVTSNSNMSVTFAVKEQFKGEPRTEVTLSTASSCSMSRFTLGETYLVEATPQAIGDDLHAYLCSHTRRLPEGARTLEVVRRRGRWWQTRLSRVSWYRLRGFIFGRFG